MNTSSSNVSTGKKAYEKPTAEFVALKPEERLMSCGKTLRTPDECSEDAGGLGLRNS